MSDDRDDPEPRRMIYEIRRRVQAARNQYWANGVDAEVSDRTHRELAIAALQYYDVLYEFRDEPVLDEDDWPDVEVLRERVGKTVRRRERSDVFGEQSTVRQVPAVSEVPVEQIVDITENLDDLAKTLGFGASTNAGSGGSTLPNVNRIQADSPDDVGSGGENEAKAAEFEQSHFFRSLYKDIEGDRGGGAIVIVDAEDARTGVGKTGAACAMAEFVAWYFGYDLQDRDGVLSGQEYLELFKQHPNEQQVSVAVWDEAVGAGSGDARRAMAQENVDLGRAWQIMRDRRVITFVTLPDWGDLDSRLQKLADYRVWCRRDIGSLQAYEIGTRFEGGDIRTRGLGPGDGAEPISFPDVTDESELYQAIKAKKDAVQESDSLDAGDLVDDEQEADSDDAGPDLQNVADKVIADIDEYISVNSTNKMEYVDADLIQMDFDLSIRKARTVKKLVEKAEAAP